MRGSRLYCVCCEEEFSESCICLNYSVRLRLRYDYTDGVHLVKVVYTPNFDDDMLMSGRFTASAHVVSFLENADYQFVELRQCSCLVRASKLIASPTHVPVNKLAGSMTGTVVNRIGVRGWELLPCT